MSQDFAWMVKPTAQETWAKGKGMIVWLSFAFGLAGAGSYLVSLFFGTLVALVVSWAIVTVLKNFAHLSHAKHPTGMWRMILRPGKSWIARGTIVTALFSGFGLLQILAMWLAPDTVLETILKVIAGLLAVGIVVYEGCALGKTKAIPFWNNGMVPVVFMLWAATVGLGFVLAFNNNSSHTQLVAQIDAALTAALLVCMALYLWGAKQSGQATAASVSEIVSGSLAAVFWVLVILLGAVAPGVVLTYTIVADVAISLGMGVALFVCHLIGSTAFVYCIFKAGKYRPLVD